MELNAVKIRDLLNQKEQLLKERQDISDCIKNIDKEIEQVRVKEAEDIFETIKPHLKKLEKFGYFVKFQYGPSFHDPYTDTYHHRDNYYSLEKM